MRSVPPLKGQTPRSRCRAAGEVRNVPNRAQTPRREFRARKARAGSHPAGLDQQCRGGQAVSNGDALKSLEVSSFSISVVNGCGILLLAGVGGLEDVAFMQSLERGSICQGSPGRQKCESRGTATSGVAQELQRVTSSPGERDREGEATTLTAEPPDAIKVSPNEEGLTDLQVTIEGPEGPHTPADLFRMKLLLGKDFPASPHKGYFLTKVFHPNVGANGEICVNVLKTGWTAEPGI
ncbi:hypothetical protein EI555_013882 [Monodon monoceros]|uniref:UBC core domain-containing protein n=1 Tax=Monodon monoceros TaxID=40151 RepID=A0A4U1F4P7_MONMO|nr:hypothetical protein EI555_013882 [Monodon monoceros]